MSDIVKFPYSASRRVAARRPRRSKNGTPEERAAKLPAEAGPATVIPRRSKNGTPEERAAKNPPATVSNVVLRLLARRTEANTPMTKDEFAAAYTAATPAQQALVLTMMHRLVRSRAGPIRRPPDGSRRGAGCDWLAPRWLQDSFPWMRQFETCTVPAFSGLPHNGGDQAMLKHLAIVFALLSCTAVSASAANQSCAEVLAGAKPVSTPGKWAREERFANIGIPLACSRLYTCQVKESMITDAHCKIVYTPPQTISGVCTGGGGTCDSCLTNEPKLPCNWHQEKR